jgi:hypothetical protein
MEHGERPHKHEAANDAANGTLDRLLRPRPPDPPKIDAAERSLRMPEKQSVKSEDLKLIVVPFGTHHGVRYTNGNDSGQGSNNAFRILVIGIPVR